MSTADKLKYPEHADSPNKEALRSMRLGKPSQFKFGVQYLLCEQLIALLSPKAKTIKTITGKYMFTRHVNISNNCFTN
jgi:hypothetical protein